jgi:hypothetical protein
MNEPLTGPLNSLGALILVRLLAAGKPPARSGLSDVLKRYFDPRLDKADWNDLLQRALTGLEQRGLIEPKPYRLTDAGRQQAATFLGLAAAPANLQWTSLRNRYLVALALGIDPADKDRVKQVGTSGGVRAAVLVRHFGLPGTPVPSESRVKHLLAWRQLREAHDVPIPPTEDISHNAILKATMLRGQHGDPVTLLAAQATKAENTSADKVREAVIRQWLGERDRSGASAGTGATSAQQPANGQHGQVAAAAPFDLARFAERVRELARTSPTGRFGENKVFLSHIWERFHEQPGGNGMSRAEFERHLVEANRQDLLALSRADLVSAMDPADVEASEIRLPHSTFQFVRADR